MKSIYLNKLKYKLNYMDTKYYCLSLKKYRDERFLNTKLKSFDPNKISIIEFNGVDGTKFKSSNEIASHYNLKLGDQMIKSSPILIAIAQSHRNIWKDIIDSKSMNNIIFEDDIQITTNNFIEECNKANNLFNQLSNPKMLSIGYLYTEKGILINSKISKTSKFAGLQCYMINLETAEYLYNNTFTINDQIDTIVSDILKVNKYYLNKQLVIQKNISSIAHNQRNIFLEYNNIKFFSKRIGINFKINIGSGYHINFTLYTILNVITAYIIRLFYTVNYLFLLITLFFLLFETFIYGGVNWLDYDIFRGINPYSRYDDDEVVNKLIDYLFFIKIYLLL